MDCIRMSQDMGFKRFEFVKNARYKSKAYDYKTGEEIDIQPWHKDNSFNRIHDIKQTVETKNCMHLSIPSIFLSAEGVVSPCCYMPNLPLLNVDIATEFSNNNYRNICVKNCG